MCTSPLGNLPGPRSVDIFSLSGTLKRAQKSKCQFFEILANWADSSMTIPEKKAVFGSRSPGGPDTRATSSGKSI